MTAQLDALDFDGEPFDGLLWSLQAEPAARPAPKPAPPVPDGDRISRLLQEIRADLVTAHLSAMSVQAALQRRTLATLNQPTPGQPVQRQATQSQLAPSRPAQSRPAQSQPAPSRPAPSQPAQSQLAQSQPTPSRPAQHHHPNDETPRPAPAAPVATPGPVTDPEPATTMSAFKALARTPVTSLDAAALTDLTNGRIAAVFGPAYDQDEANPEIRLAEGEHGRLTAVHDITRHAGPWNRGQLRGRATVDGSAEAAVEIVHQAAQVFAMQVGLHLTFAGARFHPGGRRAVDSQQAGAEATVDLIANVAEIDLIPRPHLRVDAELRRDDAIIAQVRDVVVEIREADGAPVGPETGGVIPRFFGRRNMFGDRALLNEFHMTHSARGDLAIALGPEFAGYAGRRATRMPNHGLQLCDRVMAVEGTRGNLTAATAHTEYDSPADSWYYLESANASMPNVVYMETSLQSALLLGYYLGATLTGPDEDYSLRNLDGTATVLREVDLRDKTIQQTSRLLNTTVMVGAVLQTFGYELSVDGEPFYAGESLFGFFNETALANQNGLDNGDYVGPWLDGTHPVRTIDVAARRAGGTGVRCAHGHLSLVDSVQVVDGGGKFGNGYLHAVRPVRPDDWFFTYHFYLDPVMPGSLGIEAVIQAMQEWAVDAGLADGLTDPEFVVPANLPLSWRYRGQILADDREMTLEVHIKQVERRDGRVRVVGEASVWKPGLRIYELSGVAVELRGADAEPW